MTTLDRQLGQMDGFAALAHDEMAFVEGGNDLCEFLGGMVQSFVTGGNAVMTLVTAIAYNLCGCAR